jgi:peptidylprolyl isomerase
MKREKYSIHRVGRVRLSKQGPTPAEVLTSAPSSDWRTLDPERTIYLELPAGRVVIELNAEFAPASVSNITTLVREVYFDGLFVVRAHDNFVVQWGDPDAKRSLGSAKANLPPEFTKGIGNSHFTALQDRDTYAPQTGFIDGFPVARDLAHGMEWLVHCYGMVGVGRDADPASGNGTALYAVIGQAPRHLDRNVTLVGRVVSGMELLSVIPRGTGMLGFYERPDQRVAIRRVSLAADVLTADRTSLELLRTDSASFVRWIDARRNRRDAWFQAPAAHIDVCNIPIPTRTTQFFDLERPRVFT